jgi:hypothetical protein
VERGSVEFGELDAPMRERRIPATEEVLMKAIRMVATLAVFAAMVGGAVLRAEENQVWTGSLVDASCYATDSTQTGDEHMGMKQCGQACLKMGRPAGIVTSDKKFFVLLAPSPDVADYVGQPIRITGKLRNGSILVDKFEVKKSGGWVTIKLSAMM